MSVLSKSLFERLFLDASTPSGVRWKEYGDRPEMSAGSLKDGVWVITVSGAKLTAKSVAMVLRGEADEPEEYVSKPKVKIEKRVVVKPIQVRGRSGMKGVKVIRKDRNGGVTGYQPRIKRKGFSWAGEIQTDKRVAAEMVDAKLIEIDGAKARTNKSLGLI